MVVDHTALYLAEKFGYGFSEGKLAHIRRCIFGREGSRLGDKFMYSIVAGDVAHLQQLQKAARNRGVR